VTRSERNGRHAAVAALIGALGADAVLTDPEQLREYGDPYAPSRDPAALAIVLPSTIEHVRDVLRIATEFATSLWTVSAGRNHGYGGAMPRTAETIIVSLRRMNRVLEVNDDLAYALVEPGVTFFDLYEHLRAGGHKLWAAMPDLGLGSVVGNALDHGWGYTVDGDRAASVCGIEVVLADGQVLRTGMGALPASRAWQAHPRGFGPSLDSLFMQSNLGIVTKMGVRLMRRPEAYRSCWLTVSDRQGLAPLVDTLRSLLLDGTIRNVPLIESPLGAGAMVKPRREWYQGDGPFPEEAVMTIARELGIGRWNARFALYGPPGVVAAQFEHVERLSASVPGAGLRGRAIDPDKVDDVTSDMAERTQAGIPGLEMLGALNWWGDHGGHLDFSAIAPLTGDQAVRVQDVLRPVVEQHGLDYSPGFILTPRSLVHICPLVYDPTDQRQTDAAREAYPQLIQAAAAHGYGVYRTHVDYMDLVASSYDFGDGAQLRVTGQIKNALDPAGILSPGKQGIWPGHGSSP
jgi:4-cresol dehydrogenase (hydroxylating)